MNNEITVLESLDAHKNITFKASLFDHFHPLSCSGITQAEISRDAPRLHGSSSPKEV